MLNLDFDGAETKGTMRPTMQRTMASQRYNEASMYPEHATSRRSERLKATRKNLGASLKAQTMRKLEAELPSKDLVYTARSFMDENSEASIITPGVISPESLLGYHLKRQRKPNW